MKGPLPESQPQLRAANHYRPQWHDQYSTKWVVWLFVLIWSSIILAALWGAFLADPMVHSIQNALSLGLLWCAGLAVIILFGYRWVEPRSRIDSASTEQLAYRLITQETSAAVALVDPYGRFRLVSDSFCQLFGRTREEVIGQRAVRFAHPEDVHILRKQYRLRRRGLSSTYQVRFIRGDGAVRWLSLAVWPVYDEKGRYCGGLGLVADITEQKQAEEELRLYAQKLETVVKQLEKAQEEAQAASRAKTEFLAAVSHELRTPLTAILGYAEILLLEGDLSRIPPNRLNAVQTILRNGESLLQIVNDLLEMAKMETGRLELNIREFSLIELIQDVVRLMQVRAETKKLPLRLEVLGPVPKMIRSDPLRLRQILINLIGNAIKFTEHGSVRLVVQVPKENDGSCTLRCEVIDTGIGVPHELCDKIFEPFHRGDAESKRRFSGTGLGLSVSRAFARRLGGDITVVSEVGLGSNFCLTIPLGAATQYEWISCNNEDPNVLPIPKKPTVAAENFHPNLTLGTRVLLVDECLDTQRLFAHILAKAGADLTTAGTGREALRAAIRAMVEQRPYDCILLDMQLPDLDGHQVARMLRESGYTAPIVALTANSLPDERERCLNSGCDDFASKPLNRRALLELVAKYSPRTLAADSEATKANP
ncbi:MAG: ATP-binding protein [Thermogutta sp.]